METKKVTREDYSQLCELWESYGYPKIPFEVLPSLGSVAFEQDKLLAYSGVFIGPDKYAFIAFTIANKNVDREKRYEAINLVLKDIKNIALENKAHAIYGFTGNNTLINLYKDFGFQVSETNCTSLIMPLDNNGVEYLT